MCEALLHYTHERAPVRKQQKADRSLMHIARAGRGDVKQGKLHGVTVFRLSCFAVCFFEWIACTPGKATTESCQSLITPEQVFLHD
jgi:hypothetical protein